MFGHGCCFCKGGSGVNVFTATHPLGPYNSLDFYDIGCDNSTHSGATIGNCNSTVHAQQNCGNCTSNLLVLVICVYVDRLLAVVVGIV